MQSKNLKGIKLIAILVVAGLLVWFLGIQPRLQFRQNEKTLEDAARRYFELNQEQLPTGQRVKTLSLNTLYKKAYLKDDFKAPYTNKLCSLEKSWVKVRRENGEYRYYIYLDCGILQSAVDHTGPQIKMKGPEETTINMGDEYKDPGISSVSDDTDGKLDVSTAVTVKGEVDSEKTGTYEIQYTAFDSLSNKTIVTRKVHVVNVLSSIIKRDLGDKKNYIGEPLNNYVRLSNMYFQVFGLDKNNNVILVAEEDIANVNYTKVKQWLDEVYMEHFTDEAKKLLVKTKFCDMKVTDETLAATKCTSYTEERYVYIPSNVEINLSLDDNKDSFMKPRTMSWVAARKNDKEAYVTRNVFFYDERGKDFYLDKSSYNYGVRPMVVMKGDTLVVGGDGSQNNPYVFGETKKAKGGDLLNTRYPGEFITSNGYLWRIIEVDKDGTTKVISEQTLGYLKNRPEFSSFDGYDRLEYDPKNKESIAYQINNKSSEYIDVSIFSTHEVEIPVYKNKIVYGEAKKYNKYKVKLVAPSIYDMFSAQSHRDSTNSYSYWLCDTAEGGGRVGAAVTDIGVPINEEIPDYSEYGIRVVGFLKKGTVVSNGKGTYESPYKLK